ncbi:hypothetical protein ACEXQD_04060 [Herbiconiux sp. P15]|uniref:hypothetical protein n=1 Tax=Herbiconiux liukaitaii TaxID=3342799 RepID=UPI0035B7119A
MTRGAMGVGVRMGSGLRTAGVGGVAAVAVLLAGCVGGGAEGGISTYEQPDACTLDAALVTEVIGTSAYVVAEGDASALPIDGAAEQSKQVYLCRVEGAGEVAIVVEIGVASPEVVTQRQQAIEASSLVFTTDADAGSTDAPPADGSTGTGSTGTGGVGAPPPSSPDAVLADWICGEVGLTVRGTAAEPPAPESIEALVRAFAAQAGCWTRPAPAPAG